MLVCCATSRSSVGCSAELNPGNEEEDGPVHSSCPFVHVGCFDDLSSAGPARSRLVTGCSVVLGPGKDSKGDPGTCRLPVLALSLREGTGMRLAMGAAVHLTVSAVRRRAET